MNATPHRFAARAAASGLLVLSLIVPLAVPVAAADPTGSTDPCATPRAAFKSAPGLADAKALGDCMASNRLVFLGKATSRVQGSKVLTSGDRSALLAIVSTDTSAITSLKGKLDSETTVAAVVADMRSMVLDYRIYLLVGRQVALVTGADAVSAIVAHFGTVDTKLTARIAAAAAAGKDVAAAQASLAAMNASVAQAKGDVDGLPAKLLVLTPAQYDAGTARPTLDAARAAIRAARDALVAARKDAAAVLDDLGH